MTDKPLVKSHQIEVLNPRYTGATPAMIAGNLLKQKPKPHKKLKTKKSKSASK